MRTDLPAAVDLVIIGAGQAGLAAAGELVHRGLRPGIDFLLLDAEEGPGGAWRHRWESLTVGRAHRISDLPHLPAGPLDEHRPSSQVVSEYYGRYEEAFALAVRRPVEVLAVRSSLDPAPGLVGAPAPDPAPGPLGAPLRRDTVLDLDYLDRRTGEPGVIRARMVLSATGTWTKPRIPLVAGAHTFTGRVLHTSDYTSAEEFAGERVIVVGGGLSAVQFLLEIAPLAASTLWATRRPPNFTALDFDEVWGAEVERAVDERTAAGIAPASVVRTTGIPRNADYLEGVASGILVSRGMFDLIGPHGVRFSPRAIIGDTGALGPSGLGAPEGGLVEPDSWRPFEEDTWVEADVIFWNTGFAAAIAHLAPLGLVEDARVRAAPAAGEEAGARELQPGPKRGIAPGEILDSGIRMRGRVEVIADPRVLLVGYGSGASTFGATRAGRDAARIAMKRLTGSPRLPA